MTYKPEVGTECEVKDPTKVDNWAKIEITAIGNDSVLAIHNGYEIQLKLNCTFRPLKSPQEIEREDAIEEMKSHTIATNDWVTHLCSELYDKGYRLVGKEISANELCNKVIQEDSTLQKFLTENYVITKKVK